METVNLNFNSVEVVIQEFDEQRVAVGQDPVTQGLDCTLYTVPSSVTTIIGASLSTVGSWTFNGLFNVANGSSSPGLSIMPVALQSVYTADYIIKCTGYLVVTESGLHQFSISSDDGANLYISGLLINNDGIHSVQTKSGAKSLNRGVYSFELDYLDIGGSHELILDMDGALLPSANLYH